MAEKTEDTHVLGSLRSESIIFGRRENKQMSERTGWYVSEWFCSRSPKTMLAVEGIF